MTRIRKCRSASSAFSAVLFMKQLLEYIAAWAVLKGLGLLPRRWAVGAGRAIARAAYALAGGLRRTGRRNLEIAFPEKSEAERERILRGAFENLGRQLGEFSQIPKLRTPEDARRVMRFENADVPARALERGRGMLFLTGHVGAWEMSAFCFALAGGTPINFLVRRIDNPRVEALADRYRTSCGNRTIDKRDAARAVLSALRRNEMVGILADLNTLADESVFVDFFGLPASTTPSVAVLALRSDAPVVLGYTYWDEAESRYALRFEGPIEPVRTGSKDEDVRASTARFTSAFEEVVRRHPDQWLWIHRRWKTRPPGTPSVYSPQRTQRAQRREV
jgi:KDO2-lipid IV(A) lauroyltransferase